MPSCPASERPKQPADTVQFVLLCHTDAHGEHFDLMIEEGPHLATWKFSQPPHAGHPSLQGRRIFDHRRAFLDYEGPLSGDKGHVRRIDKGTCRVHTSTPERWDITLSGSLLVGRFVLTVEASSDQEWSFRAC